MECPFDHPLARVTHADLPKGHQLYVCCHPTCEVALLRRYWDRDTLVCPFNDLRLDRVLEWAMSIPTINKTKKPKRKAVNG